MVDGASIGGCARYDRRFLIAHSEEHFYGFFGNDASLGMAPEARRAISRFRGVVDAGSVFLDFRGARSNSVRRDFVRCFAYGPVQIRRRGDSNLA